MYVLVGSPLCSHWKHLLLHMPIQCTQTNTRQPICHFLSHLWWYWDFTSSKHIYTVSFINQNTPTSNFWFVSYSLALTWSILYHQLTFKVGMLICMYFIEFCSGASRVVLDINLCDGDGGSNGYGDEVEECSDNGFGQKFKGSGQNNLLTLPCV